MYNLSSIKPLSDLAFLKRSWRHSLQVGQHELTTGLGGGKKRHILVCFNDPEARNEPPKCWLMERGTIKLLSKSFNALCRFYSETGLERAGEGGKRSQRHEGIWSKASEKSLGEQRRGL